MATVKDRLTSLKDTLADKLNQLYSLITGKADKTTKISAGTGLTGGGTLAANRTIGLSASTQTKLGNGDTAYGWGDHSQEGYLTSVDISNKVDKTTKIIAGTGLTGGGALSANRTINHASHTGDVTGATALTIGNNKVTFAKMQDIEGQTLIGRYPKTTGDPQLISLGSGLKLDANTGVLSVTSQGSATALPIIKHIERVPTSYSSLSSLQFTTIDSFVLMEKEMIDHEYRGELAISVSAQKNASYGTIRLELFNKYADIELPKLDSLATGSASVMVYVQYKLRFREYGNQTYCRLQFLGTANYTYFGYDGLGGSQVFNSVESSLDRTAQRTLNVQMKKTTSSISSARVESHFVELLYRPINE